MTTAAKISSGSGLRRLDYFLQDTLGYPTGDESGADGYDGTRLSGVKGFVPTVPDVVTIQHTGDDVTFAQDYFAPSELPTATITTGKTNLTTDSELAGTLVQTIGEAQMGVMTTDIDGQEPDVIVQTSRQALDTDPASAYYGKRRWNCDFYPISRVVPKAGSADYQSDDTNNYNVIQTKASRTPWGIPLSTANNGATEAVRLRFISEYPMRLERWTGDGTIDEFNLAMTPISVAKTQVWTNGTAATVSAVNTSTDTFTLSAPAGDGAIVVALYETSDKI